MPSSKNLKFSFLESAQAQKHVTVNEALFRLDALNSVTYLEEGENLPAVPQDGDCFVDPKTGSLAIASGGAYASLLPRIGMSACAKSGAKYSFDGANWRADAAKIIFQYEVDLASRTSKKAAIIPEKCAIFGVTARVKENIIGTDISSWSMGVADDPQRYGYGFWLGKNGWARGLTGTPMTYWQDTQLVISPDKGSFTSGKILVYIHLLELPLPPEF